MTWFGINVNTARTIGYMLRILVLVDDLGWLGAGLVQAQCVICPCAASGNDQATMAAGLGSREGGFVKRMYRSRR